MAVLHPHPTKPGKLVCRQRLWQIKRAAKGLCVRCGAPRVNANHCQACAEKQKATWDRWYQRHHVALIVALKEAIECIDVMHRRYDPDYGPREAFLVRLRAVLGRASHE